MEERSVRDVYINMDALLKMWENSDALKNPPPPPKTDRVLKSLRVEDQIYKYARSQADDTLSGIEESCKDRLPTVRSLSRDMFQSFYALNLVPMDESSLTATARKLNKFILDDVLHSKEYPAIKAICEGRDLPAYEAAVEYMEQIGDKLDTLLEAANRNGALDALEKKERQLADDSERFHEMMERRSRSSVPDAALEKQILRLGNRLESVSRQVEALDRMVDENLMRDNAAVAPVLTAAREAANNKAEEVQCIIRSWGSDPASMENVEPNRELLEIVRENQSLKDIAKYLGRFREMLRMKRKNDFAYGRGEKYSLELGNKLQRVISSEFALLGTPQTIPLFLRKYQKKSLKQYQRREKVYKGYGDMIVCLDESGSTRGENAAWGKALALALMEQVRDRGRSFALVHFASAGSLQTDLFPADQPITLADQHRVATTFLGGGTDFEAPMREALRLIEECGFSKADIVFVTDGVCEMPGPFVEVLREKKADHRFTVTGVLLDMDSPGQAFSLQPFCNEVYRTSQLSGDSIVDALLAERM